ncbi:MAG: Holliday junction resolvase RuvX [Alloprevotella sp.]|nr:Holliday junction resolvase RuvX [Alloprevotella sp.]
MGRILCIDYGKKRCGIAVTDVLQIIPNGLTTVPTHELLNFLETYIQKENVERFVLGLPKQPNGQPSENQARVLQFAKTLQKKISHIPIDFYDERFTSVLAHQAMLDTLKKEQRRNKELVDEISACIILRDYLESQSKSPASPY